jgi:hypothetical protein
MVCAEWLGFTTDWCIGGHNPFWIGFLLGMILQIILEVKRRFF